MLPFGRSRITSFNNSNRSSIGNNADLSGFTPTASTSSSKIRMFSTRESRFTCPLVIGSKLAGKKPMRLFVMEILPSRNVGGVEVVEAQKTAYLTGYIVRRPSLNRTPSEPRAQEASLTWRI